MHNMSTLQCSVSWVSHPSKVNQAAANMSMIKDVS